MEFHLPLKPNLESNCRDKLKIKVRFILICFRCAWLYTLCVKITLSKKNYRIFFFWSILFIHKTAIILSNSPQKNKCTHFGIKMQKVSSAEKTQIQHIAHTQYCHIWMQLQFHWSFNHIHVSYCQYTRVVQKVRSWSLNFVIGFLDMNINSFHETFQNFIIIYCGVVCIVYVVYTRNLKLF